MNKILGVLLLLTMAMPAISVAVDIKTTVTNADLDKKKQSESKQYLTAKQAYEVVTKNPSEVLFIDVRTPSEVEFVGWTPLVDAVIPYMNNDFDEWDEKNSRYTKVINGNFPIVFEALVAAKGINKNSPIIFICRSGTRSSRAAS